MAIKNLIYSAAQDGGKTEMFLKCRAAVVSRDDLGVAQYLHLVDVSDEFRVLAVSTSSSIPKHTDSMIL